MGNVILSVENLSKEYTDKVGYKINLLKNINLHIDNNEFVSILAPSGSGKSSLLKIIGQVDKPTSCGNFVKGKITPIIPSKPASFPWLNVYENIKFNSKYSSQQIQEIINLVGLNGYEDHFPNNKSKGFRFRISLGRGLANNPELIIVDEPFNNLNSETRKEMYELLRKINIETKIPFLYGTTNISETIFFSDRIYLMKKNPGEIVDEINVTLPHNRTIDILESEEFISIRTKIENKFKKETDQLFYNFSI